MFTNPMFYIGWVIIASLPLMVAIIAPQQNYCLRVRSRCHLCTHVRHVRGKEE